MASFFAHRVAPPLLRRQPARREDEPLVAPAPHRLIQLQQTIGNAGVQRLLAHAPGAARPPMTAIQRFWGDEDEESEGGGWFDQATNEVSSWFGGGESEPGGGGSGSEVEAGPGGWSGGEPAHEAGGGEAEDSGGSWWDQATDEVSSWFEDGEEEQEPAAGGDETSWWDQLWGDEEDESEESDDSNWWDELWSDEEEESEDEEVTDEPPREIESVAASCRTEDTIGHGEGKKISLHGLTTSNYDHAKPIPAPFPSSVKVTERKVKVSKTQEQDVFDASGTFEVTFASNPSISLPTVPSGLTPCQEKAVQAFIDGPLTAHENDHKNAFVTNYDGKFTATVNVSNIKDTPEMRKRAMENPVMTEDQKRATAANSASAALDPWKQTVPGLDCKEPEKKAPAP